MSEAEGTRSNPPADTGKAEVAEGPKKVKQRGSPNWPTEGVISLRVDHNPKRPGTLAEVKFARYRHGMTVAEFIAAGGTYTSLKWDTEHGYIAVNETAEGRAKWEAEQKAVAEAKAAKEVEKVAKAKARAEAKEAKDKEKAVAKEAREKAKAEKAAAKLVTDAAKAEAKKKADADKAAAAAKAATAGGEGSRAQA